MGILRKSLAALVLIANLDVHAQSLFVERDKTKGTVTLFCKGRDGHVQELYKSDRDLSFSLSPNRKRISVTDYAGSAEVSTYLFEMNDLNHPRELNDLALKAAGLDPDTMDFSHVYVSFVRWHGSKEATFQVEVFDSMSGKSGLKKRVRLSL